MSGLVFSKVLIANRGEIAWRIYQALQQLQIPCVAIYHESDKDSPLVKWADEAVEITGESPTAAYLDMAQIIGICKRLGVDAVHPGYGFLSENARFAKALAAADLCFIGPSAEVIELMGDKITSREFVAGLGYPIPPSIEMVADEVDFSQVAEVVGFPLVVKASAGGGGKGMSIVHSLDELASTLRVAASEAEKYFGDKRVYIERYFSSARHIEVQVLGDGNNVIHLGERECSIQRRFQKVIEESPSPALSEKTRRAICDVAVGIAKAANYSSAGTVEFLYTPEGEFFFLEMNTRIQVEHPVTEMVTGVDLVVEQIKVAAGLPLALQQQDIVMTGHAIECRICAEDAFNGFLPETGKILLFKTPKGDHVRFDGNLYQGQKITAAYDPMLAKLIVYAPTREQAIAYMQAALKELIILGVNTNIDYLGTVIKHPVFNSGDFNTAFVDTYGDDLVPEVLGNEALTALLSAAMLSDRTLQLLAQATPDFYRAMGEWRN